MVCRGIGRLAFPIFAFMMVQGFCHTKNFLKYFVRVLLLAIVSEIPYNIFSSGRVICPEQNNILFTLAMGLILLRILKELKRIEMIKRTAFSLLACAAFSAGAWALNLSYSYVCILLMASFYVFGSNEKLMLIAGAAVLISQANALGMIALLALFPILLYNGEKGRGFKWFFYAFYPLHLTVFAMIRIFGD